MERKGWEGKMEGKGKGKRGGVVMFKILRIDLGSKAYLLKIIY